MQMERLDKVLSNLGYGSRKEIKAMVKNKMIRVDGEIVKDSGMSIEPGKCILHVGAEEVKYRKYIYLMMNKPDGVISATYDPRDKTVVDLLEVDHAVFDPFPVGRLDKDTVGLLLLTNDGDLNHRLISPKWHVDKVYYAEIDGVVTLEDVKQFEKGVTLDDGYKCLPGKLEILETSEDASKVLVTIQEGKFHQVKRMFQSVNKTVTFLKRISFGPLALDENLKEGEYRELTEEELKLLQAGKNETNTM